MEDGWVVRYNFGSISDEVIYGTKQEAFNCYNSKPLQKLLNPFSNEYEECQVNYQFPQPCLYIHIGQFGEDDNIITSILHPNSWIVDNGGEFVHTLSDHIVERDFELSKDDYFGGNYHDCDDEPY